MAELAPQTTWNPSRRRRLGWLQTERSSELEDPVEQANCACIDIVQLPCMYHATIMQRSCNYLATRQAIGRRMGGAKVFQECFQGGSCLITRGALGKSYSNSCSHWHGGPVSCGVR
jgi:hypothetical protein